jgi:hypothetical protein
MDEKELGYLNYLIVAGLVGHRLADAERDAARDEAAKQERRARAHQRRARVARMLLMLAARLAPSMEPQQAMTVPVGDSAA